MNKKSKRFIILILILLLLIGLFFGLQKYNERQSAISEESGIAVVDIAESDIAKFSYDYNGETLTFEKEEDIWRYAPDTSLEITQYMISDMLSGIAPLTADAVIEEVTDMSQ